VHASLADQAGLQVSGTLALGLGANLPSSVGAPRATLVAVRPLLEALLQEWVQSCGSAPPRLLQRWSPLFLTAPVGGPAQQPSYSNAVLLLELPPDWSPALPAPQARELLAGLQRLESQFGRQRLECWGPRSLDLDLLWIGCTRLQEPSLVLPHPRVLERAFVLAPLVAIDPQFSLAGLDPAERSAATVLAAVLGADPSQAVSPLPASPGWLES
jgi:2-amino-4-hydroxy-6-hydroxymethyldihydropteridine diphosphokinase